MTSSQHRCVFFEDDAWETACACGERATFLRDEADVDGRLVPVHQSGRHEVRLGTRPGGARVLDRELATSA